MYNFAHENVRPGYSCKWKAAKRHQVTNGGCSVATWRIIYRMTSAWMRIMNNRALEPHRANSQSCIQVTRRNSLTNCFQHFRLSVPLGYYETQTQKNVSNLKCLFKVSTYRHSIVAQQLNAAVRNLVSNLEQSCALMPNMLDKCIKNTIIRHLCRSAKTNLLVYCFNTAKQNSFKFFVCRAVSRN